MNKLVGGAVTVIVVWGAVKLGLLDAVIGGIIGDLAAELERMSGPLALLLVAGATPAALVGLAVLISRKHRAVGVELIVVAAVLVFGAWLAPVATHWMSVQANFMSANLSRSTLLMPASAPSPAATPVVGRP